MTLTFLSLVTLFTAAGVFLLYAMISVAALLFVWRGVPETKGRTLEEIEKFWLNSKGGILNMNARFLLKSFLILAAIADSTRLPAGDRPDNDLAQRHMADRGFEGSRRDPCLMET